MSKPSRRELQRMNKQNLQIKAQDLGVEDVTDDWTKADLIDAIEQAGGTEDAGDEGQEANPATQAGNSEEPQDVPGAPPSQEPGEQEAKERGYKHDRTVAKPDKGQQQHWLMVNSSEAPDGNRPVEVSINGYLRRIPRDKWVKVPYSVIEVLNNAVHTSLEQTGTDEIGAPIYEPRHARRFSFQAQPAE